MRLGQNGAFDEIAVIPTGAMQLDVALGIGGIPRGRVIEIYGPESSGKTTLALTIISHAQRQGGNAVFIDAEHALDASYAQKLGVDIANLHVLGVTHDEAVVFPYLGLEIWGGDAIVKGDRFSIVDFNDWPSFSRVRNDAARAIARRSLLHLRRHPATRDLNI